MDPATNLSRYVQLTDAGLARLHAARRRYHATLEDIVGDPHTPSVNTVRRALRGEPVFVSTLERIWEFFQRLAAANRERLPYLLDGEDYAFVDSTDDGRRMTDDSGERGKAQGESDEQQLGGGGLNTQNSTLATPYGWLSHNVPRPNRLFTGREDTLDRLHAALGDGAAALIADPQALTGLGGIGKTQTALAYVYRHWREYSRIFWVSAETVESLNDGLAGFAEELGLLVAPNRAQALQRMHDWFRTERNWLLVLDNADDIEALAAHFPQRHGGRLILTTRARNTVKWAAPIMLHRFGAGDGALLLLRRAGLVQVRQSLDELEADLVQDARALSEELGGLPLAIDQAGAYMAETGTSVSRYRELFREQGLRLLDRVVEPEHASVTATFSLALDQMASRTVYGAEALDMARLCAFLYPDDIPERIFASTCASAPFDEICAAVCRFSLASRHAQNRTLTVHRLVQIVTRDGMSEKERADGRRRAVEVVAAETPDFEFEDWPLCELLLPQWRVCAQYIRADAIRTEGSAYLLYQAGRYLRARALFEEAETFTRLALEIAIEVRGATAPLVADYVDELACLCRVLDRREEAERLHVRSLDILEASLGADHLLLTSKLHNLGVFYVHTEQDAKAEPLFLRALEIHERQPEPDLRLIATAQTQLAGVYRNRGDYVRAEHFCLRALETYEEVLPQGHVEFATASNNLGLLYLTMGSLADAEQHYSRALDINMGARGETHPETGNVLWGLARVRWRQGRSADAEALFQRAIRIYCSHLGRNHSRTARILESYAEFQGAIRSAPPVETDATT